MAVNTELIARAGLQPGYRLADASDEAAKGFEIDLGGTAVQDTVGELGIGWFVFGRKVLASFHKPGLPAIGYIDLSLPDLLVRQFKAGVDEQIVTADRAGQGDGAGRRFWPAGRCDFWGPGGRIRQRKRRICGFRCRLHLNSQGGCGSWRFGGQRGRRHRLAAAGPNGQQERQQQEDEAAGAMVSLLIIQDSTYRSTFMQPSLTRVMTALANRSQDGQLSSGRIMA